MKKPAKVIPLGKPLDTPDDDLDMLALVTPSDIEEAKADARARMGDRGAALLETARDEVVEENNTNERRI
jgi:hypothetical protein